MSLIHKIIFSCATIDILNVIPKFSFFVIHWYNYNLYLLKKQKSWKIELLVLNTVFVFQT